MNRFNKQSESVGTGGGASDDEDSDGRGSTLSYKERRREAHTQAEQKRRDAIKKGYDYLQDLVPSVGGADETSAPSPGGSSGPSSGKASKAVVLQKAIDYIQFVEGQKRKQDNDINSLKKELIALQIMRDNYEQLVKAHQSAAGGDNFLDGSQDEDANFVPSQVKFMVFQLLMDSLFQSFNDKVGMNNFSELSGCIFSWLEEHCKPQNLQELMLNILQQVKADQQQQQQQQQQLQQQQMSNGQQRVTHRLLSNPRRKS